MLTIKLGVAIHADYSFQVISADPSRNTKKYLFVDNELTNEGLDQHGKDIVHGNAVFGTSNVIDEKAYGCFVPVRKHSISKIIPTTTMTEHPTEKTVTITSAIEFRIRDFGLIGDALLDLREFGIENYNRIVLEDSFQELEGLRVGVGDEVLVEISFNYTYYTNNLTNSLGEDVFGERVDYTCEVVRLRDKSLMSIRNNPGYATDNPIDVFPLAKDIRTLPAKLIDYPVKDEYQQEKNVLDDTVHRLDAHVLGYYEQQTTVYGFILRDNLRGIGVLVRFLKPVIFASERRYEAMGYIQWTRTVEDIDDGYITIDLEPVEESVVIQVVPEGTVSVLAPSDDVAIQLEELKALKLQLDRLGIVVNVPDGATWQQVMYLLQDTGLFEKVELLSNRVGAKNPSLYEYAAPNATVHGTSTTAIEKQSPAVGTRFYPAFVAGGDLITNGALNTWRYDCYFPYFGDLDNSQWTPYVFMAYTTGRETFKLIDRRNLTPITTLAFTGVTPPKTQPLKLTDLDAMEAHPGTKYGIVGSWDFPVEGTVARSFKLKATSDFDTPQYDDWIEGVSEITVNARAFDLRSDVVSDNRKDVTSFTISESTANYNIQHSELWINKVNYGRIDQVSAATLLTLGVVLTKTTSGLTNQYTFTRPYNIALDASIDMYIIGNRNIAMSANALAAITMNTGTHGYKVFSMTGSDITSTLYPRENPFLCAGVKLFQPTPDYIFKYTTLTIQQASVYFNDPTITKIVNNSLITSAFNDSKYKVDVNQQLSWKSDQLDGRKSYPAIGVDLSRIGSNIPGNAELVTDGTGKVWTKDALLASATTTPERIIGGVLYFVTPYRLVEGTQQFTDHLVSEYYEQRIDLDITTLITLDYPLESAVINPNPMNIVVGLTQQATYTYEPPKAVITSAVWNSLNNEIATVNEFGLVTGVKAGQTTVRLVLNERVIATAIVNVIENELDISCDGAVNITPCLNIEGTSLALNINDQEVRENVNTDGMYNYFRDVDNFRIVNCAPYATPTVTKVSETNFLKIEGQVDLWIDGSLIAKNLTEAEVVAFLNADGRFTIFNGVDNV